MKTLAIGLAAALGLALPASADTVSTRVQFAQAKQDGGAQSGARRDYAAIRRQCDNTRYGRNTRPGP